MRHFILAAFCAAAFLGTTAQKTSQGPTGSGQESKSPAIISNYAEKEYFNSDKKYEIIGHIKSYAPESNNRFISFRGYKVFGKMRDTSIQIDKNGNFHAVLYQPFEGNTSFYYSSGDGYIFKDLYISPGIAITLSIDENKVKSKAYSQSFTSSGKYFLTNRLIRDFVAAMERHHFNAPDGWPDSKLSADAIASYWNRRMKEELDFYQDYVKKNRVSDPVFKQWEENKIIYAIGRNLAYSLFGGRTDTALTYQSFFHYFRNVPIERPGVLRNSDYFDFIQLFALDLEIIENVNPAYISEKKKNGNDIYPLVLAEANKCSHGIARELLYANLFNTRLLAQSTYAQRSYSKNVRNKFIQAAISKMTFEQTKPFETFNILEKLKSYKIDDSLKTRLIGIFAKYDRRYLFLDFWGSWCGPCMLEMPVYSKFIAHFNADSIGFLFLSYDMTQHGVDEVQKKYGINGDFILLSTNEMKVLNNVLGFEAYPRHFVLKPGGRVINNDISSILNGLEASEFIMNKVDGLMTKGNN